MAVKISSRKKKAPVGIYWRKTIFFGFLFLTMGAIFSSIGYYKADSSENLYTDTNQDQTLTVALNIAKDGSMFVNGSKIGDKVALRDNFAEVRLPIIDNPEFYYSRVEIDMTLPEPVANQTSRDVLAIHGIDRAVSYVKDDSTIVYMAENVSPGSTLSVIAQMPKSVIQFPLVPLILNLLNNVKSNAWVISGILLPLATLIFMILFIAYKVRRQKIDYPKEENDMPPMALPPALVGALYHQKVGPREIAATLVDLALRGDIFILDREREFAFLKNRLDKRLLPYEKILLSKIFHNHLVANREEIDQEASEKLYSKKASVLSVDIYNLATRLGYFSVNPRKTHLKYRLIAVGAFFVGLAGLLLSFLVFDEGLYIIFFWAGMMVSSLIVAFLSASIPVRTQLGQENLSNWLAFRKYLSNPVQIPFSYEGQELFFKYLPYAIALDCEVMWAKRFSEHSFMLPEWFVSDKSGMGLQDFCLSLFPIVSYVSRSLTSLREPGSE